MIQSKGGLTSSSKVSVATTKVGICTWVDKSGSVTVLDVIEVEVIWGSKPGDRWTGQVVKDSVTLGIVEKIRARPSPLSAKAYTSRLEELSYLDYRYGACDKAIIGENATRYTCNAAIVIPGLDGYRCSKCGWVFKTDLAGLATSKGKKRKEKKIEQVPLPELPSSQLQLFNEMRSPDAHDFADPAIVWAARTEDDVEAASLELLEAYQDE